MRTEKICIQQRRAILVSLFTFLNRSKVLQNHSHEKLLDRISVAIFSLHSLIPVDTYIKANNKNSKNTKNYLVKSKLT